MTRGVPTALLAAALLAPAVAGGQPPAAPDALKADAALQGRWERVTTTETSTLGKAERAVKEIVGDKETVSWYGKDGAVICSHRVGFKLSESGAVKVFTFTGIEILDGPEKGTKIPFATGSTIYRVEKDELFEAAGLLQGNAFRRSAPYFAKWKRIDVKRNDTPDDLAAVVEKARAGGALAKLRQVRTWTMTQDIKRTDGGAATHHRLVHHVRLPDRLRVEASDVGKDGGPLSVLVVNGTKGWRKRGGEVAELDAAAAADLTRSVTLGGVRLALLLDEPGVSLTRLPDGTVGGRPPAVVRATAKGGHADVLHLDRETGQVLMTEQTTTAGRLETRFSDFREVAGVPLAHARTLVSNGKVIEERTHTFRLDVKLDDALFEKP